MGRLHLVLVAVILSCLEASVCCFVSLMLPFLCSSDLLFFLKWAGWCRDEAFACCLLSVLHSRSSGGSTPLLSSPTNFQEQGFGKGLPRRIHSVLLFVVARSGIWEPVGSSSLWALLCVPFGAALWCGRREARFQIPGAG